MSTLTSTPVELSREDLLELHRQQIEQFGGQHGVRDWSALDRVIAYIAAARDPIDQATLLLTEISAGSPFHDGNKRCAAHAALVALLMNGRQPNCSPEQIVILLHALDMREIDYAGVTEFFASHCDPASPAIR